ncbi:MAG: 1-(5-phosphoribosyl)-5-[(5-phosphoribosylamino)methylideneamino] imidazole-4-carboxamide isomerase [Paracoccaceae bacterium]|nr:1-(5-phosphoribosyl)-5-[(5-phosphoribosylamino)methylideneamino] imidazole-4-carboxamide isomerase [Paracoccaceae bacterium]MDG2259889.1 1-(5-phosphoribosyl)-5-[(5-phosphoribosylamino)methylideneamino] imidazole-4-carboxamide isomerase [Paracoccaceae bacterium]
MLVVPGIELQKGRCVTLQRGRLDEPSIWHVDPVEKAREFSSAGASLLHVTDFDAVAGETPQNDLIESIIRSSETRVQVGGGIRTKERAAELIEMGAARVVMGTVAALQPQMVQELANTYPDQIILAVDIWQGGLMTEGWRTKAALAPEAMIEAYAATPLAAVVITDIDSDIENQDAQLGVISGLAGSAKCPVYARGTVHSIDDIARLKYIPGIEGALVCRALFDKSLDLIEAIEIAKPEPTTVADFQ